MWLDLKDIIEIPGAEVHFDCELPVETLDFPAVSRFIDAPHATGRVINTAGVLTLEGSMTATMVCVCDRCGGEFEFRKGPLFSSMILADEINRATPRTQSALLEAMEEKQITVDGTTYPMASPFMVMATQNPIESYGTFPLPEAQMDRFFMRLSMGYMEREQELSVVARPSTLTLIEELQQVVTTEELHELRRTYHEVQVSDDVAAYIMDLITATRETRELVNGVSTRGAIALYKAAQVTAAMEGRDYVIPEDVQDVFSLTVAHRLLLQPQAEGMGVTARQVLEQILSHVPAPKLS